MCIYILAITAYYSIILSISFFLLYFSSLHSVLPPRFSSFFILFCFVFPSILSFIHSFFHHFVSPSITFFDFITSSRLNCVSTMLWTKFEKKRVCSWSIISFSTIVTHYIKQLEKKSAIPLKYIIYSIVLLYMSICQLSVVWPLLAFTHWFTNWCQ